MRHYLIPKIPQSVLNALRSTRERLFKQSTQFCRGKGRIGNRTVFHLGQVVCNKSGHPTPKPFNFFAGEFRFGHAAIVPRQFL